MTSLASAKSFCPRSSSGETSRNFPSSSNHLNLIPPCVELKLVLRFSVPSQKMNCDIQNMSVSLIFFLLFSFFPPHFLNYSWFNVELISALFSFSWPCRSCYHHPFIECSSTLLPGHPILSFFPQATARSIYIWKLSQVTFQSPESLQFKKPWI